MGRQVRILRRLIRTFLTDYLHIVEHDAVGEMRLGDLTVRRKSVDGAGVVAETADGVTVLVQIEPEALPSDEAETRLSRSLRGLRLLYGEPVLASLVNLRGGRPGMHLESGVVTQAGRIEITRIFYTALGLEEARAECFLERPEPLAWAFAACMRPMLRTPAEHRRACLERIAGAPLDAGRRALLRRGVGVFLPLTARTSPAVNKAAPG